MIIYSFKEADIVVSSKYLLQLSDAFIQTTAIDIRVAQRPSNK